MKSKEQELDIKNRRGKERGTIRIPAETATDLEVEGRAHQKAVARKSAKGWHQAGSSQLKTCHLLFAANKTKLNSTQLNSTDKTRKELKERTGDGSIGLNRITASFGNHTGPDIYEKFREFVRWWGTDAVNQEKISPNCSQNINFIKIGPTDQWA